MPDTDPRIYQGWKLTEVPLEYLRNRDSAYMIDRAKATEVAPGVFIQVTAWGDFVMPGGEVTRGAQIAVWRDEPEPPVIDMGCLSLPAEVQSDAEMHVAGRPGGSMNPTPDCGGPRKPPGATEVWWCGAHGEFHGEPTEDESHD